MEVIRVSLQSAIGPVAGAIAGQVREEGRAEVQAIGGGAVNQAVGAIIAARGCLAEEGIDAVFIPFFNVATINGEERTVVRLVVERR